MNNINGELAGRASYSQALADMRAATYDRTTALGDDLVLPGMLHAGFKDRLEDLA